MDSNEYDRTMPFADKVRYLTEVLNALGYQIIAYDEPNGVSLSGYDDAFNYIEMLDLDIFTIDSAVNWVTSVWMARAMALTAAMDDVQARIATMPEADRATLREGILRMALAKNATTEQAKDAEEAQPYTIPDIPEKLVEMLNDCFITREAAIDWLDSPARYLGNQTPRSVLAQGLESSVESALEALASGIFI